MIKKILHLISDLFFVVIETLIGTITYDDTAHSKMGRFTKPARDILTFSKFIALDAGDNEITLQHLLIAFTRAKDSDAYNTLQDFDIIEAKLLPFFAMKKVVDNIDDSQQIDLSEDYKKVLELSVIAARNRNKSMISSAIFLIGLVQFDSQIIDKVLEHFNVEAKDIIKRADYYLNDTSTYEHAIIQDSISRLLKDSKHQQRKKRIKSTLQSFGFGQSARQEDE